METIIILLSIHIIFFVIGFIMVLCYEKEHKVKDILELFTFILMPFSGFLFTLLVIEKKYKVKSLLHNKRNEFNQKLNIFLNKKLK